MPLAHARIFAVSGSVLGERVQALRVPQVREVDLVVLAVQGERHGVLGGAAVEVVLEAHFNFLSHRGCSFHFPHRGVMVSA